MTPTQVVEYFGGRAGAARALEVTYEAVRQWESAGKVPMLRQLIAEKVSGGQLKPDAESLPPTDSRGAA